MTGPRDIARWGVAAAGAIAAVTEYGWLGYVAVAVVVGLLGRRVLERASVVVPATAAVVVVTAVVHAAFFGAGRYGLVVAPFVAALAFAGRGDRLGPGSGG
jgi:hypothetical protein